jgi:DEAD/DEAH box helicase domain-containing protein
MALAPLPEPSGDVASVAPGEPALVAVDLPPEAPAFDSILEQLDADGRLVHVERLPAAPERHGEPVRPLPPEVVSRLGGVRLWTHQAEAIDRARDGQSVVVATGTASGKSLCFQLPIAEAVADPVAPGTAIVVYPTKALAHDQLRALVSYGFPGLVAGAYDGDASPEERTWIRENANVVLTNPEMLHAGLLPRHAKWSRLLMRLRYVVVDELHVLRGIFGTHTAHVLRRLRRLCAHYGSDPTFVFSSATIGQPERLAAALCGKPVSAVDDDGSPRGRRRFALLDPPVVDEQTGARTSANTETASIMAALVESGHRTIAFCRSRKGTELVTADVRRRLGEPVAGRVMSYRAGYLADERRDIEDQLFSGSLNGVVATSALELGVDVGGLDACVMNGFPGTIASMWQQAGRAGRRTGDSAAVLVGGDDQLDRWFMRNPRELFERSPEPAVVNTANPFILEPHLACAAYELPLSYDDQRYWQPDELHDGIRELVHDDRVRLRRRRRGGRFEPMAHWCGTGYPARDVSLRSGSSGEFRIIDVDADRLVGTVDQGRAFTSVHPGAIYLHRGQAFEVIDLDLDDRVARVVEADGDQYTQARSEVDIRVLGCDSDRPVGRARLHLGAVEVVTQVTGYQLREARTRRILSNETLELPEQRLVTRAFWYTVADELITVGLDEADVGGSLHAAEHAAIGLLPLFTICDRWDVGGVSTPLHPDTGRATIFVYDGYPGGAGIAELGWEAGEEHLRSTVDLIEACECADGCPSCVQSPKCGNFNDPLDKHGAIRLLEAALE